MLKGVKYISPALTMIDKAIYYFELFLSLCGDIGSSEISILALLVVLIAAAMVVYAFYRAIFCMIWPGEISETHIKRTILDV